MTAHSPHFWLADLVLAFRELEEEPGGVVWLRNVYEWVNRNRPKRPKNYDAVVRATIYHHSSDSDAYIPGNPDAFRKVAHGGWALRVPKGPVPARSDDLTVFVLTEIKLEELLPFAGRGDELVREINRRVEELRKRFNMG